MWHHIYHYMIYIIHVSDETDDIINLLLAQWCSMKVIAVQTIIYDVYLARTGNCDIGTTLQVTCVRRWDWSNTVLNAYRTVSLHGAIVKITENRVIINVYLQELCYILLVMKLWGITVKCMVYVIVGSLYLLWGPYISDWDSETNCFTIILFIQ